MMFTLLFALAAATAVTRVDYTIHSNDAGDRASLMAEAERHDFEIASVAANPNALSLAKTEGTDLTWLSRVATRGAVLPNSVSMRRGARGEGRFKNYARLGRRLDDTEVQQDRARRLAKRSSCAPAASPTFTSTRLAASTTFRRPL